MTIKNYIIYFYLIVTFQVLSQNKYEYLGAIMLSDSLTISYKLELNENNGKVTGFSITDIGGKTETKSVVFGEYDKASKELSFRETQTIYTKTPLEEDYEFCYINTTLKNFSLGKTKKVKSNFLGLFADNTPCINGELLLSLAEKVQERMDKFNKKISNMKQIPDSIKQQINLNKMMDSINMNVLRANQTLSMFSKSKKLNLEIYDGGKVDGDKITIQVNGKTILNSYSVANVKRTIPITLNSLKTEILILANNEGEIAPNTVVVEINDGVTMIKALSNLKKGESTRVNILKSKTSP